MIKQNIQVATIAGNKFTKTDNALPTGIVSSSSLPKDLDRKTAMTRERMENPSDIAIHYLQQKLVDLLLPHDNKPPHHQYLYTINTHACYRNTTLHKNKSEVYSDFVG